VRITQKPKIRDNRRGILLDSRPVVLFLLGSL
jgi:hypothetical protein